MSLFKMFLPTVRAGMHAVTCLHLSSRHRFRWNHKYSMLQFRAGNHGGVCRCCRRAWTRFSNWIGEDPAFRYSPWMLAAVLAAFHVLLFSFFTSLFKLIGISDCLKVGGPPSLPVLVVPPLGPRGAA